MVTSSSLCTPTPAAASATRKEATADPKASTSSSTSSAAAAHDDAPLGAAGPVAIGSATTKESDEAPRKAASSSPASSSDQKVDHGIVATTTTPPSTSPLDVKSLWKPFLIDETNQCYSHYLLHEDKNQKKTMVTTKNDDTTEEVEVEEDTTSEGRTKKRQRRLQQVQRPSQEVLDDWFRRLHPSNFVKENGEKDDDDDKDGTTNDDKDTPDIAWTDSYYKGKKLLRQTSWIVFDERCHCEYGYSDTWQKQSTNHDMITVVKEIATYIQEITGDITLNCCNLNYYPQGGGVGYHADDEYLFDSVNQPTRIVSFSLCGKRRNRRRSNNNTNSKNDDDDPRSSTSTCYAQRLFQVKLQNGRKEDDVQEEEEGTNTSEKISEILLGHGDVITMEGYFQKYYFHSVWPGDSKEYENDHAATATATATIIHNGHNVEDITQGERINLTFRTIVQHLNGDPTTCHGIRCPLC